MIVALKLAAVLLLVLLNGFFVACEFAIVKVRSTQLRVLAQQGSWRARIAERVVGSLDAMLSACQLGITLATIGLGWAGEPWVADLIFIPLAERFGHGLISNATVHTIAFISSYIVISAVHIVVGEQAPKVLAIQRAQGTALWIAVPLQLFYLVFYPAIWLLNHAANFLLRLIGIEPASEMEVAHSDEELRLVIARSRVSGHLTEDEQRLLNNVLNLTGKTARHAMDPRTAIVYLDTRRTLDENLRIARQSGHTRFPLCNGDLDHVIGMAHVKDLLWAREARRLSPDFREVRRRILFLPETLRLDLVLRAFQQQHIHMAILVDEFGATVGMITMENVIEELVGEIQDEFDQERPPIRLIKPGEYRVDALCSLDLFKRLFGFEDFETESTTVGGLVFERLGHLPETGETAEFGDGDRFVVEEVEGQRIASLRFQTRRHARWSAMLVEGAAE
jgi:CBS domain containing-hemolysin-like protein